MDRGLRELERKVAAGDQDAQQRLVAAQQRIGIRAIKSGGRVVTDVIGMRVWRTFLGQEQHDYRLSTRTIVVSGRIVAAYVPDIAATSVASSNYSNGVSSRSSLHFVVQTKDGAFDDQVAKEWHTFDHPKTPKELQND